MSSNVDNEILSDNSDTINAQMIKDEIERIKNDEVSFDDINPKNMFFSPSFACAKSTSGRIIAGLCDLIEYLQGKNKKTSIDAYQKNLYLVIIKYAELIIDEYIKLFVINLNDKEKKVYGYHLNGKLNDGNLNKSVACKGLSIFETYEHVQFGQLINLLEYRLKFLIGKDINDLSRHLDDIEIEYFKNLQKKCINFCDFIKNKTDGIYTKWSDEVSNIKYIYTSKDNEWTLVKKI